MSERGRRPGKASARIHAVRDRDGLCAGCGGPADDQPTSRMPVALSMRPPAAARGRRRGRPGLGDLVRLIPVLATLMVLGVAAVVTTGPAPWTLGTLPITDVPQLVDHDLPEATSIAGAHGLTVAVVNTIATEDRPRGTVVSQDPQSNRRVRKPSEVKLTISAGIRPPDVVGRPLDEARAILVRGGWSIGDVEASAGAAAPTGTVVEMRPGPGELATHRRQPIGLVVSGEGTRTAPASPTVGNLSPGWGMGASATVGAGSSDRAGRFSVAAGSSDVSANPTVRLTFSSAFGAPPVGVLVLLTAAHDGPLGAAGVAKILVTSDRQPGYVEFLFVHTPVPGGVYVFDYMIAGP